MGINRGWRLPLVVTALIGLSTYVFAEQRTWTDKTGKFSVTAELVEAQGGKVVLRREDGQEITVPTSRLSDADRAYLTEHPQDKPASQPEAANDAITSVAQQFFSDLRTQERDIARQLLTTKAQALMTAGRSPLVGLPQPELGDKGIRLGKVNLEGEVAEIPVFVRAGGRIHKTKLHVRQEDEQWVVFALSAVYPDGERSINFEIAGGTENIDPLQSLVGKQLELEGYTHDGRPLSLAQYKGKVVLVDFWATWCGPCRAEIPNILQNYQKHHTNGFDVIAVSVDQDLSALKSFVAQEQPPWAVVADNHPLNKRSMAAKYGIRGIPAFILVGTDGKVAAVHCRGERLGQQLGRLLASGG